MANISKEIFERNVTSITDCQAWHSFAGSCCQFRTMLISEPIIGSCKFLLPIYFLKFVVNWRRLNKKYLREQLEAFISSMCFGVSLSCTFGMLPCIVIKFVPLFYWIVFLAGSVGSLAIWFESVENRSINAILACNQILEIFLNYGVAKKIVTRTPLNETATFMVISACLMYLFRTQETRKIINLWFYPVSPLKQTRQERDSQTPSGNRDLWREASKYFAVGYTLDLAKKITPRFFETISNPKTLAGVLFDRKHVQFGLFLGGYVAIYRYVIRLLARKDRGEFATHSLIAGFVAGSTYRFRPNMQFPIIAITTSLQLIAQRVKEAYDVPEDFPYSIVVFCLVCGLLLHFRFWAPGYCPKFMLYVIDTMSNNVMKKMQENFASFLKGAELQRKVLC